MSKRNSVLGTASGKLGDTVYYRRKGQQASRTYRASIAKRDAYANKLNRAKLRNGINFYNSLGGMDISPLISATRFGYLNNKIASESIKRDIVILKSAADAGNAFPFNFVTDILPVNSIGDAAITSETISSRVIAVFHTTLRVASNTTPTTVAQLLAWLQTYNPQIVSGDYLGFFASTYPEQYQDIEQSTMPNFAPIPSARVLRLSAEDTTPLATALAGFTIGSYSLNSGGYALKFYADIETIYSTSGSQQCPSWKAIALFRKQGNGRKEVYFRMAGISAPLAQLLRDQRVNPYRNKAVYSY